MSPTNDLLQYWEEDPATDMILLYVESFGNPRRFARIARRVSRRKPIIAVKAGRSHRDGGRPARTRQRSRPAMWRWTRCFIRPASFAPNHSTNCSNLAAGLSNQPLPPGRRVGIVTNAGGPAILCTDACEAGALLSQSCPI